LSNGTISGRRLRLNVGHGSQADISQSRCDVRFTPATEHS
jgi:hypothetical protein